MSLYVCRKCYTQFEEGISLCPKCGEPYKSKEQRLKEYEDKIGTAFDVGIYGAFGVPLIAFGFIWFTLAILGFLTRLTASPLFAFIGLMWGILIGGISFRIGKWLTDKIGSDTWKGRTTTVATISGILIGLYLTPRYLEIVSGFY